MPSSTSLRAGWLAALRRAETFDVPEHVLIDCLRADSGPVANDERIADLDALAAAVLLEGAPIASSHRAGLLPILGSIGEATIEAVLENCGWQPVADDAAGYASAAGVDLIMMDPAFERMMAIEVKSTVQHGRWPRLAGGAHEQMTSEWLDRPQNVPMVDADLKSVDIVPMVVQIHLRRRLWRAAISPDLITVRPIRALEELDDLGWLDEPIL